MVELHFEQAKPIWPEGRDKEINVTTGFRTIVYANTNNSCVLRLTASSLYRIFVNGRFAGHGPARGPHGFYRLDEWDLSSLMLEETNVIAVEVVGYNVNSYYLLNQPSFLQAELLLDGKVLSYTSAKGTGFEAEVLTERVQKVQRYSFQRTLSEYYRMGEGFDAWRRDVHTPFGNTICTESEPVQLIPRGIGYGSFQKYNPVQLTISGQCEAGHIPPEYWRDRALTDIGPLLRGYEEESLEVVISKEMQEIVTLSKQHIGEPYRADAPGLLGTDQFDIFDFGINRTGFIGLTVRCTPNTKLYVAFDEVLSDGDVDFKRFSCVNAIGFELSPGVNELESMEPYTLRYMKLIVMEGECSVEQIYIREYANEDADRAYFHSSDDNLNIIFKAGVETFKQNASDLFMDCPSRERAGWLCDSFFTARVEHWLTGSSRMERSFLENYLLPDAFPGMPEGMLPMCYPADHDNGEFIPNWALWFVVELEEYLARSGDKEMIAALRPRVMKLFDYFHRFMNEDGLLEGLESWVFLEWSKANELVQDVNYPSNMLYAGALAAAGRIYGELQLLEQAERIRETIRKQSFNGQFFVDNALRRDGRIKPTSHTSEVCQYYAFFFDVATPESHSVLWHILLTQFGPARKVNIDYPLVYEANAFIGNYLRLDLLSRNGSGQQALQEMGGYFRYMADLTGTLWENIGDYASCNHGFASHVVHWLYRDALGIKEIDHLNKKIRICFDRSNLSRCEGHLPVGEGLFALKWVREGDQIRYVLSAPTDYEVILLNDSGLQLVPDL